MTGAKVARAAFNLTIAPPFPRAPLRISRAMMEMSLLDNIRQRAFNHIRSGWRGDDRRREKSDASENSQNQMSHLILPIRPSAPVFGSG